jgi:tRNA-specific 2-thiouridylase
VVIGEREELLASALRAERVNWLIEAPSGPLSCQAKIRYHHEPAEATVTALEDGSVRVDFAAAQSAITPGQAVAFYDGERMLGGGWIEEAIR